MGVAAACPREDRGRERERERAKLIRRERLDAAPRNAARAHCWPTERMIDNTVGCIQPSQMTLERAEHTHMKQTRPCLTHNPEAGARERTFGWKAEAWRRIVWVREEMSLFCNQRPFPAAFFGLRPISLQYEMRW